jgi:hypothetical protein
MAIQDPTEEFIVSVDENVCLDDDLLSQNPFDWKAAGIYLWTNALNDYAISTVRLQFSQQLHLDALRKLKPKVVSRFQGICKKEYNNAKAKKIEVA